MEDAARLAECFNSFDDSDSWPGGFTRGIPYTAERILEDLKKGADIRTLVAYEGDKIVGHCNVVNSTLDEEAVYVGLLGVNPAYQGKGYGKYMLIEAAETAARMGKRRIDLHTWGGNLKAIPLYKRVGYNWVPNTRVLMESHIPGIIGSPMFQEFFEEHDWYESLKVDVKQEMDDIVEEGIGIFKYHFEGLNGDTLDVTIDREAKGICGFRLFMDGKTLSAKVLPEAHTGFIGIGEIPVKMEISNETGEEVPYSFQTQNLGGIVFTVQGSSSGKLNPGTSTEFDCAYALPVGTRSLDRETTADDKIGTQVEWKLDIGGKRISMFSGVIPNEAVIVSLGPRYPCLVPGERKSIDISLRNNTTSPIKGEMVLAPSIGMQIAFERIRFHLKPREMQTTQIEIMPPSNQEGYCFEIDASIYVNESDAKNLIKQLKIEVPVIGPSSAVVYRSVDNFLILENEHIRVLLNAVPPNCIRQIHNKSLDASFGGWALQPELGYPFEHGGSEWERKEFDITTEITEHYAEFRLRGDSEEKPGLVLTNIYRIYRGREDIEISTQLENHSPDSFTNLGLRIGGWIPFMGSKLYLPIDEKLYCLDDPSSFGGRQIPKDPARYHENWAAVQLQDNSGVLGFIWDAKHAKDLSIMRQWRTPRVEYDIPDLESGMSMRKHILNVVFAQGNWKRIRSLSARLSGRTIPENEELVWRKDLDVGFTPSGAKSEGPLNPILYVDRHGSTDVDFNIRIITDDKVPCDVRIKLPPGLSVEGSDTLEFKADNLCHTTPVIHQMKLQVNKETSWFVKGGEILLKFAHKIYQRPLSAVIYDSKVKVAKDVTDYDGKILHTLVAGDYRISTSPNFWGNLVHYGKVGEQSLFYDTFPEAKPFIWDNKHYSGLRPRMSGYMVWDWQSSIELETWVAQEREIGPWIGYELTSTFAHSSGLKGIKFTLCYMLLRGTPLVYVRVAAENQSSEWKRFDIGFNGVPRLSEAPQSIFHTIYNGQRIQFQPTEVEMDFLADASASWGAYEDPSNGTILGVILTQKDHPVFHYSNEGEKGQWVSVSDTRQLASGDRTTVSGYLLIADEVDDVQILKDLPAEID